MKYLSKLKVKKVKIRVKRLKIVNYTVLYGDKKRISNIPMLQIGHKSVKEVGPLSVYDYLQLSISSRLSLRTFGHLT